MHHLALVLEFLWWIGDRANEAEPELVSEEALLAAIGYLDSYAVPMARRCFGDAAWPEAARDAAAVARAVYPGGGAPGAQPRAVVLADQKVWQAGLAAAVLMSQPLRAPLLLSDGGELPRASADALDALAPTGAAELGGAQVVRVGGAPAPAIAPRRSPARTRSRSRRRSTDCKLPRSAARRARC